MPDLPTIAGGPSESASTPGSSGGIVLTAGGSANTKAATYTTLIATTAYATNWIQIQLTQASAATSFLVDLALGASTAEVNIIDNLFHMVPAATTQQTGRSYLFPLRIPAGVRLSARCQAVTASATVEIAVQLIASPMSAPPGLSRVETIGALTASSSGKKIDCGGTAHTDVIAQLSAAIGMPYRWMCVAVGNTTDTVWAGARTFLIDIVKGAGGSEVEVIGDMTVTGAANTDTPMPGAFSFPVAIASGERVAARARCSVNTAGDRVLDIVAYGVA